MLGMMGGCFTMMVLRLQGVAVRGMSMVGAQHVISAFIMLSRFAVVVRGLVVMLRRISVVLGSFVLCHWFFFPSRGLRLRSTQAPQSDSRPDFLKLL